VAAANGDLIQVIDDQSYLGQQILNVYYYRITAISGLFDGYLNDLNTWFEDNVMEAVRFIQNNGVSHNAREWRNLTNGVDLFTDSTVFVGQNGTVAERRMPSYVSAGFMLQRESLLTRNGYKRFAGIDDGDVEGNTWTIDTDLINAVESALAADITLGLATVAEPIILKRPIDVPVESYVYSSIGSASFRGLGTQNTRKAGRGV